MTGADWATPENAGLFTDLYELTMMQAYQAEGLFAPAVFDLFFRRLPAERNYLIAAGLDTALAYLENLHFPPASIDYLASLDTFSPAFLDYLAAFRFTGEVRAVAEGTPVFADEPIVEIKAPLPEAQLAETFLLNQLHFQTLMASKAARVVEAARGRTVVDFGARRMHGADAALKAARAFYIAGVDATSNVLAGQVYGLPVSGTMAHSYIEAHDDEAAAFAAFAAQYPETVLLVDTYDTLAGVRTVADLARQWGDRFRVRAIRLDSGDLGQLAAESRRILDTAGLEGVGIFASGSLDEYAIADLVARDTPIDGFGVGTHMGVSADRPFLDSAYKLVAYAGEPRMKLATRKVTLPGEKQIYRVTDTNGHYAGDTLATADEPHPGGTALLQTVMRDGQRTQSASLDNARAHAQAERERLPTPCRALTATDPYPVATSDQLAERTRALRRRLSS